MDIEDDLRIVLVGEAEDRRPRFYVVDGRVGHRVDSSKEHFESFRRLVDIDDGEL